MFFDFPDTPRIPWTVCSFAELVEAYKNDSSAYFLLDSQVMPMARAKLSEIPKERILILDCISESNKTLHHVEKIIEEFVKREVTRNSTLIAVGGGILTDIVGFVGAIYQRGVKDVIYVPTTLLSMVDAGLGGKTGVNFDKRKNFIGAYITPKNIIIDVTFLQTLPPEEIKNAIGELVKYEYLSVSNIITSYDDILSSINRNVSELLPMIESCLMYKHNIVTQDFKENHLRKFLNLGHTFGHAFEGAGMRGHGRAVLQGIVWELLFAITQTKDKNFQQLLKKEAEKTAVLAHSMFKDKHNKLNLNKDEILTYLVNDKKRDNSYIEMPMFTSPIDSNKLWQITLQKIQISTLESFIKTVM